MKDANEITLRLLCPPAEFCRRLEQLGFQRQKRFRMEDAFFIPPSLPMDALSVRDILARAVLVRSFRVEGQPQDYHCLTFKQKTIAPDGRILSQSAHNCTVADAREAKELLTAMGCRLLMELAENDVVYDREGLSISVKDVEQGEALIEIETDSRPGTDTAEALIQTVKALHLPLDTDDCFVKKAEIILSGLLGRN